MSTIIELHHAPDIILSVMKRIEPFDLQPCSTTKCKQLIKSTMLALYCMHLPGSETPLNAITVNIILSGIDATANDMDTRSKSLLKHFVELLMKEQSEHEFHDHSYAPFTDQLRFKQCTFSGDFQCVIGLLMNQTDTIFAHGYRNIKIFNHVLRHLPQYVIEHSLNASRSVEFIMNHIMRSHKVRYNTDTYRVLMDYHGSIMHLCDLKQTNPNHHHDIHEIVRRLIQIEGKKQSKKYQTFIECVRRNEEACSDKSRDKYLIPDPTAKCSANEWEISVDMFQRTLSCCDEYKLLL
eukprot:956775_1